MTDAGVAGRSGWFKSSFSKDANSCVEVRFAEGVVYVRDSKYLRDPSNDPATQPVIAIAAADWPAFLEAATNANIEVAQDVWPSIDRTSGGDVHVRSAGGASLTYTATEWVAFTSGVLTGEFAAA